MSTKVCKECGFEKAHAEYYKMGASKDGLHYYCKACCALHRKRDAVTKRDRRSGISNRQRYRATSQGIAHEEGITLAKLYKKHKGICAICSRFVEPRDASPDHIIPIKNGGLHTWENLQLTHLKCNKVKGTRSHESVKGLKPRLSKRKPSKKAKSRQKPPSSHIKRKPSLSS